MMRSESILMIDAIIHVVLVCAYHNKYSSYHRQYTVYSVCVFSMVHIYIIIIMISAMLIPYLPCMN